MARMRPCVKLAAKDLQLLVRVEAALVPMQPAIVKGKPTLVYTDVGEAACVTCGAVLPYARPAYQGNQLQGGHCLAGCQNNPEAYLDERNVHPQCSQCNKYKSGAGMEYRQFINTFYPIGTLDDLTRLKNGVLEDGEELTPDDIIDKRVDWKARTERAKHKLENYHG